MGKIFCVMGKSASGKDTIYRKLLEEAYDRLRISGDRDITDDTMIVERYMDVQSKMIEGSYENFKVTTPEDIRLAELFL